MKNSVKNVEDYINSFPLDVQEILYKIRKIIRDNARDSLEEISYGLIGYKLNKKPLVYFGAFKKHIGFYATPTGHSEFFEELSKYKQGKGSVQFPLGKPMPYELIERIVLFRIKENISFK